MIKSLKFRVEAADEDVVVTLDGTNYMVRYYKADNEAGLKLFHTRGDERALAHASSPTQKQKSWVGSPKSELFLAFPTEAGLRASTLGPFLFATPLVRLAPLRLLLQTDRAASRRYNRRTRRHRGSIVHPISRNSAIVSGALSALNASRSSSGKWIKSHPSRVHRLQSRSDQALTIKVDLDQQPVALRKQRVESTMARHLRSQNQVHATMDELDASRPTSLGCRAS